MKKTYAIFILIILVAIFIIACNSVQHGNVPIESETIDLPTDTTEEPTVLETKPILFDESITFTYEYVIDGEHMPYVLYTPSTAEESDPIPLIVWLHGGGEVGAGSISFLNSGLLKVLNEWPLEGFNAYVLCPHLYLQWNSGSWHNSSATNNVQDLLDMIIENYNIDTDNVIVVGHSLGGDGAAYMAYQLPEYFSKLVVLSGFQSNINYEEITISALGYVGTTKCGEASESVYFTMNTFALVFGKENTFSLEASHADIPMAVFTEDKDGNNRSDVIEWMFADTN